MATMSLLELGLYVCVASILSLLVLRPRKAKNLPPGPGKFSFKNRDVLLNYALPAPTSWLVGNRNQVPPQKPWRWFQELNDQYGPVVYLQIGQTPTVVIGTAQAAWEILEKKSPVTSSRPRFIMARRFLLQLPEC